MNMSIAAPMQTGLSCSTVGSRDWKKKINEAVQNGIPVVTVMGDAVHSKRQSLWVSVIISLEVPMAKR